MQILHIIKKLQEMFVLSVCQFLFLSDRPSKISVDVM